MNDEERKAAVAAGLIESERRRTPFPVLTWLCEHAWGHAWQRSRILMSPWMKCRLCRCHRLVVS